MNLPNGRFYCSEQRKANPMQLRDEIIVDYERILVKEISKRFKKLRGKTPYDIIANGQATAIKRIEKGEVPSSGNFISDTLLENYQDYFGTSNIELIFGNEEDIKKAVRYIFFELSRSIMPEFIREMLRLEKNLGTDKKKLQNSMLSLFYTFADFGRWYNLRQDKILKEDEIPIDFIMMEQILWRICKTKMIRLFKEKVIKPSFDEYDEKFHFKQINEKLNKNFYTDFITILIPEIVEKLKSDSIFKMGYMVKSLVDELLVLDLKESHLVEIPLKEYYPPMRTWSFNESDDSADMRKFAEELVEFNSRKFNSHEEVNEFFKKTDGKSGVTTRYLIDGTRKVNLEAFVDMIIDTPTFFSEDHDLSSRRMKVPGILNVNSQTSKVFQSKLNETIIGMIDELVKTQNAFINCIEFDELEEFGK